MSLIGIECSHGFGDAVVCMPLIEAICKKENKKAVVCTRNIDAFINAPFIENVIKSDNWPNGESTIRSICNIDKFYQVTPQSYFRRFKTTNQNHSLLNTPTEIGELFDVYFDSRPKIFLTNDELKINADKTNKIVFIEAEHRSDQSWSIFGDFHDVIRNNKHCQFYWLSNKAPHFKFDNLKLVFNKYTRRECISLIRHADVFISVGSGLFCGMLGTHISHVKTLMLWKDNSYRYIDVISKNKWIDDVQWFLDRNSWENYVKEVRL